MPCCAYRFSRLSATIWSHDTQTAVGRVLQLSTAGPEGVGGGRYLSDVLAHVLDDHLVRGDGLHGEKAPLVDPAASEPQLLLSELQKKIMKNWKTSS